MGVKVEKIEKAKVKLEFEVSAEQFAEAMKKAFAKNSKNFNVPGFRKGKAPRNVVERYYGDSVLFEDAFNLIAEAEYEKAIEENDIFAVDRPEIDVTQIGKDQPLIFTAVVTVKPPVEVSNYKGLEVIKIDNNVTDEEIEVELKRMQEKNARLISIEDRTLKNDDISNIDFEGFVDGVPFEGGKGIGYDLTIGSSTFIKGFEEQLVGMEIGQEKEVTVTFPEDYFSKDLADKEAVFKVKLNSIKKKELPKLDDEFAKDVSEFDTLDDLKKDITEKFKKANEQKAKADMEEQMLDKLIEKTEVEIPNVMLDKQIDFMIKDLEWRLKMQGATLDNYMKYTNSSMLKMRDMFREKAEKTVKIQLTLEEINKREKITVSDEELDEHIAKLAENYATDLEEFRKQLSEDDIKHIRNEAEIDKTVAMLMDSAKLV